MNQGPEQHEQVQVSSAHLEFVDPAAVEEQFERVKRLPGQVVERIRDFADSVVDQFREKVQNSRLSQLVDEAANSYFEFMDRLSLSPEMQEAAVDAVSKALSQRALTVRNVDITRSLSSLEDHIRLRITPDNEGEYIANSVLSVGKGPLNVDVGLTRSVDEDTGEMNNTGQVAVNYEADLPADIKLNTSAGVDVEFHADNPITPESLASGASGTLVLERDFPKKGMTLSVGSKFTGPEMDFNIVAKNEKGWQAEVTFSGQTGKLPGAVPDAKLVRSFHVGRFEFTPGVAMVDKKAQVTTGLEGTF